MQDDNLLPECNTSRPWSNEDLARLYQGRINKEPYSVLARQLGRSENALEHKWNSRKNWASQFVSEEDAEVQANAKEAAVKKLSDGVDGRLEMFRLRADVLADRLADAIAALPRVDFPKYTPKSKDISSRSPEEAGLILSDLHIGLKYTMEETGGVAEYSLQKFEERLANLREAVSDITQLHSSLYRMPRLNIFMLGDNTHGMNDVGKWSAAYIEASIVDQVMIGLQSLAHTIHYFLNIYEQIDIYAVGGNHGRAAQKGIEKDHVNWDYVVYQMLMLWFKDNPRVRIVAPKSWYIFTKIRNHSFLLMHGDDVKSGNFPAASLSKIQSKMAGILKEVPQYTLIGHFHSSAEMATNNGRVLVNGGFPGGDPHSLKAIQAGGKPEQTFFGIHERHGITWKYNIDLDNGSEQPAPAITPVSAEKPKRKAVSAKAKTRRK